MVERVEICNLDYNSKVEYSANTKVVIESNGIRRELRNIDNCIINPKETRFSFFKKKKDLTNYIIYFVDGSQISGQFGSNIQCGNEHIKFLQYETLYFRFNYKFKVRDAKKFLDSLVSEDTFKYSRKYFETKINNEIILVMKDKVANAINNYGIENFHANITKIIDQISIYLSEERLYDFGIELKFNDLIIEEEEKARTIREDIEYRKYQKHSALEE